MHFLLPCLLQQCHCKFHIILRVYPLRIIAIVCKIANGLCVCRCVCAPVQMCATNKFSLHSLVIAGNTNALVACGMWHVALCIFT